MKFGRLLLNITISALILIFLFQEAHLKKIIDLFQQSKPFHFFMAVLVAGLSIQVNAWRWQILLKHLECNYKMSVISKISFITFFFNVYLPGGVAGEIARVAMLPQPSNSNQNRADHLTQITATVVTDKVVGFVGIMILAFVGFLFSYELLKQGEILLIFIGISIGIIGLSLTLFSRRTQTLIGKIFVLPFKFMNPIKSIVYNVTDSLFKYRDNPKVFQPVLLLSILGHILVVLYFILLAESIEVSIGYLKMGVYIPIIEFFSSLPISLGGLGIREATTVLLFAAEGVPAPEAISVSLLSFAVILIVGAVGGLLYFFNKFSN